MGDLLCRYGCGRVRHVGVCEPLGARNKLSDKTFIKHPAREALDNFIDIGIRLLELERQLKIMRETYPPAKDLTEYDDDNQSGQRTIVPQPLTIEQLREVDKILYAHPYVG